MPPAPATEMLSVLHACCITGLLALIAAFATVVAAATDVTPALAPVSDATCVDGVVLTLIALEVPALTKFGVGGGGGGAGTTCDR